MSTITFILGGVRSGKSAYALKSADQREGSKAFIATAETLDEEMAIRVARHKRERGQQWKTFEEPLDLKTILRNIQDPDGIVLIDCLTLWVSNLLGAQKDLDEEFDALVSALASCKFSHVYIVSNEVGMGIVPEYPMARLYRDQLGLLNRKIAAIASQVILMVAGIPMEIKGDRSA